MAGRFLRNLRIHSSEDIQMSVHSKSGAGGSKESVVVPASSELNTASCLLCLEARYQPKVLSCSHSFCEICLYNYCRLFTADTTTHVLCPVCRQTSRGHRQRAAQPCTASPKEWRQAAALSDGTPQQCAMCEFGKQPAKADYHCAACAMNFCTPCRRSHDQQALFHTHTVVQLVEREEVLRLHCLRHNRLASLYFCLDCAATACTVCVLQDHSGHLTTRLCEMLATRRDNLSTLLQSLNPTLSHLELRVKRRCQLSPHLHARRRNTMSSAPDILNGKLPQNDTDEDLCCHHVESLRSLYRATTQLLQATQSELLLVLYEPLVARLHTVLDVELVLLCHIFDTRLDTKSKSVSLAVKSVATSVAVAKPQSLLFRPRLAWRMERYDVDELWNPCSVTFLDDNTLAVAAYDTANEYNNGLHLYDGAGTAVASIALGELKPLGVTTTREGLLATTDCLSKRVRLFTSCGQPAGELGKGQFGWPYGIVVNSRGQFIVTDAFNDTVSIYQPDGKRHLVFGSSGGGPAQFNNPYHVAVDSLDNIIVADSGNNAVKIFDSCANFLFSISAIQKGLRSELSSEPRHYKRLKGPRGVCTDMEGNILVADEHARICMFDATGTYIRSLLTDEDSVKNPEAVACDKRGLLAVTEWNPNYMAAVKVYSIYE